MASKMATMGRVATPPKHVINAVVVSAGLMQNTVKVRVGTRKMNKLVSKYYNREQHHLVHDPNSSLRTGDIIEMAPGWRVAKHVRHVVTRILAPFGPRIDERPPVPSEEERLQAYWTKKMVKDARRRAVREGLLDEEGKPILRLEDGSPILLREDGSVVVERNVVRKVESGERKVEDEGVD